LGQASGDQLLVVSTAPGFYPGYLGSWVARISHGRNPGTVSRRTPSRANPGRSALSPIQVKYTGFSPA
jgi:hypothetical protein